MLTLNKIISQQLDYLKSKDKNLTKQKTIKSVLFCAGCLTKKPSDDFRNNSYSLTAKRSRCKKCEGTESMTCYRNDNERIQFLVKAGYLKADINKPRLTKTELKIVNLVAEGKMDKHISDSLGVVKGTIELHKLKIRKKLNLKTPGDLVVYAVKYKYGF